MLRNDPGLEVTTCEWYHLQQWSLPDMHAPYFRLYWNDNQGAELRWQGRWIPIQPGHVVVIAPFTGCAARLQRPVGHMFLHCSLRPPWSAVQPGVFPLPVDAATARLATELRGELASGTPDPWSSLAAYRLASTAMAALPRETLRPDCPDPRIVRVLDAIAEHLEDPLSNASLARLAGMQIAAFARRFKQVTGTSPQHWATARRIEHAAQLLQQGENSIEAVAAACGFCDRAHFSRVFKHWRGVGPAAYRDRARW